MRRLVLPAALLASGPALAQTVSGDLVAAPAATVTALFAPYSHALASLGGWALLMMVLGVLSILGTPRARTESGLPVRDYADPFYRRDRAFRNAVETTGPFLAATVAAVLVGASPFWVNLFASVFLAARIAAAAVHIGTEIERLRSAFWTVAVLCNLALAGMAVVGVFAS